MKFITDEEYEIGLKNGLTKHLVYMRVYVNNWDIEKAITTPPMPLEERSRKHPKEYTDLAIKNGIPLITFYSRIKRGWTYEEASTVPPLPVNKRRNFRLGGKKNDKE